MHTLSGHTPVLIENQGGTGEPINNDFSEIGRETPFRGEIKYILNSIKELDEEGSKEFEFKENNAQRYNIEDYNAEDGNSMLKENFNTPVELKDSNESNYQLRRTIKLMNLYHEFIKEDVKVVLGPKHVDSSSSDSYDEDNVFARALDLNESTKKASNDSLVHSGN